MLNTTIEIRPIRCFIANKFFYGLDETYSGFERCEIFALSSYQNNAPSLNVRILSNGGLFHDLPIWAAQTQLSLESPIDFNRLCYADCPDNYFALNQFQYLADRKYFVWFDQWVSGSYIATLDWPLSNLNLHFCSLSTGQFCFMPSHKVCFGLHPEKMPPYTKKRYSNRFGA